MAEREGVQHADGDAGWRLGRCDEGPILDPKTQTHRCAHAAKVRLRLRVMGRVMGRVRVIFPSVRSGDQTIRELNSG